MFYNGVIAYGKAKNGKTYVLTTEGQAEIAMQDKNCLSPEIIDMGKTMYLQDEDLDEELILSILVDNWFVIAEARGTDIEDILYVEDQDEDRIFETYTNAVEEFKFFLSKS
jgi:hypothetical protein